MAKPNTCPGCGFEAKSAGGLASHRRACKSDGELPMDQVLPAVLVHVAALEREGQLDTHGTALATIAIRLAHTIDTLGPVEPKTLAQWTKELRETLAALAEEVDTDGAEDPDSWVAGLSSSIRDAKD